MKKVLYVIMAFGFTAAQGSGQEADTVAFPKDGVILSLSVFAPMADDMKDIYGFMPLVGVRGIFDAAPQISNVCGAYLLQKSGRFYPRYVPHLDGEPVRLRAVLTEFGLRLSSVPKVERRMFAEGGVTLAWAGERFKEGDGGVIGEKDHTGTGMGFWLGFGAERFLKRSLSVGLQGRLNLCSAWVGYERTGVSPFWSHYSIDLNGVWVGVFVGFYR